MGEFFHLSEIDPAYVSIGMQIVFIGCFLVIEYVYPFVAVFRGGSLNKIVVTTWVLMLLYTFFLSQCLGELVKACCPNFSGNMDWLPEGNAVFGVAALGWLAPLIFGALGDCMRSSAMKKFPTWMNRISVHQSPSDTEGNH